MVMLLPSFTTAAPGEWTWMSGDNKINYGTKGTPDSSNLPGGRYAANSWTDSSGNFWLFGGYGHDIYEEGLLNDLWQYNPSTDEWTWMSGDNESGSAGSYITMGTPNANNIPSSRSHSVSWTDNSGNLWLFGGFGYDSNGDQGYLNDLWRYNPSTKLWSWMDGVNTKGACSFYGTPGVPDYTSVPGARDASVSWVDANGDLWMFGGYGYNGIRYSTGQPDAIMIDVPGPDCDITWLGELWRYNIAAHQWTWMSGGNRRSELGVYGTKGIPAAENTPGSRESSTAWSDASGNLWLFGGYGNDGDDSLGHMNDLWRYNTSTGQWTWMSGDNATGAYGTYGTKGLAGADNAPGARRYSTQSSWTDSSGNLWLFGGDGYAGKGYIDDPKVSIINESSTGHLNDLWRYDTAANQWTWMSGDNDTYAYSVCGFKGLPDSDNVPGSRTEYAAFKGISGGLWLFGGRGYDSECSVSDPSIAFINEYSSSYLNDLWRYDTGDNGTDDNETGDDTCELFIKYKEIKAKKLTKTRKRTFKITGNVIFDPYGEIDFGQLEVLKSKVKNKKNKLRIKARVPEGLEPGTYEIFVGECAGEIEVTGEIEG